MEIEIRVLDNGHCRAIVDLVLPIQQIEFNVPIRLEDQPDLQDIEAHYRATGGNIWGAFAGDRLAGTIALISTGHQAGVIRKMWLFPLFCCRTDHLGIGISCKIQCQT